MDGRTAAQFLGVSEQAGFTEIRAAFRTRAKCTHPDAGGNSNEFSDALRAFDALRVRHSDRPIATPSISRAISATHGFCEYDTPRPARCQTRSFDDFLRVAIAKETSATFH